MLAPSLLKLITPARQEILRWLVENRYGTSTQIWQTLQPHKTYQHTLGDLARLRSLGLVRGFRYEPEKGGAGKLCWLLLKDGAEVVGARHGSHYLREPDRRQIEQRDMELNLERSLLRDGYGLVKPRTYNREQPLPAFTPQYEKLVEKLKARWGYRLEVTVGKSTAEKKIEQDYRAEIYRSIPPAHANDYVIYRDNPDFVAVVILAPLDAGAKFWQNRLKQYRGLVREQVPVVAVFGSEGPAVAWREYLKKEGLKVTVPARVEKLLQSIERESLTRVTG